MTKRGPTHVGLRLDTAMLARALLLTSLEEAEKDPEAFKVRLFARLTIMETQ